jgi:hypothetical protein
MDQEFQPKPRKWTLEERRYVLESFGLKTQKQLAEELNCSIGAISGIISRARLGGAGVEFAPKRIMGVRPTESITPQKVIDMVERKRLMRPLPPEPPPEPEFLPIKPPHRERLRCVEIDLPTPTVKLADLAWYHCRFPIGDPRDEDFAYCGKRKVDGKAYCKECCAIAFRPMLPPTKVSVPPRFPRAI